MSQAGDTAAYVAVDRDQAVPVMRAKSGERHPGSCDRFHSGHYRYSVYRP
jgi:hypothetical protein